MTTAAEEYYRKVVGAYPDAIRTLDEGAPEFLDGYLEMRRSVSDAPVLRPALKELLYIVTDLAHGNLRGAQNHLEPAIGSGLSATQLLEGLTMLIAIGGMSTWGAGGAQIYRDFVARVGDPRPAAPRAVLSGDDESGTSVALADRTAHPTSRGSSESYRLWGVDELPVLPLPNADPPFDGLVPPVGGLRFVRTVLHPGHEDAEAVAHDALQIGWIVAGSATLLDGDREIDLRAGDVFVLPGSPHRWRNDSGADCHVSTALLGTERKDAP